MHSGYSDTFTFPDMIDLNTQNRDIDTQWYQDWNLNYMKLQISVSDGWTYIAKPFVVMVNSKSSNHNTTGAQLYHC